MPDYREMIDNPAKMALMASLEINVPAKYDVIYFVDLPSD
jgi:hypothetical protein